MPDQFIPNPIVAHRGAWLEFNLPENSLASLAKAIEIGVGATEFDVHMTADHVLVVHHDYDFFGLKIEQNSYSALATHQHKNGETLPLLADFLKLGLAQNKTKLILEIKPSEISLARTLKTSEQLVALLQNCDYSTQLEFIHFCWDAAQHLKTWLPNYKVSFLNGDKSAEQVKKANLDGLDYDLEIYKNTPSLIAQAQQLHLHLNVWTVDELPDFDFFLNHNFDFITTNKPLQFLNRYKQKSNL